MNLYININELLEVASQLLNWNMNMNMMNINMITKLHGHAHAHAHARAVAAIAYRSTDPQVHPSPCPPCDEVLCTLLRVECAAKGPKCQMPWSSTRYRGQNYHSHTSNRDLQSTSYSTEHTAHSTQKTEHRTQKTEQPSTLRQCPSQKSHHTWTNT